jgi:predicted nucleic acid-binding protein
VDVDTIIAIEASTIGVDLQLVGKTIDLHDLYIAATSKKLNIPLVTGNAKHFEDIEGINITQWPLV